MARFNLRDLFWLVLVAAMALGWWLDRSRVARQRDEVLHSLLRPVFQTSVQNNSSPRSPQTPPGRPAP